MRLHTLSLTAVGPFAETQQIDFERLGSGGLFLFEGPTGVGKSTILDALVFALYGGLASDSGDVARMRSDFVDESVRPVVALEFSVRGERHRVTRSPEFRRPKLRGPGTTVEKASVHLERWESGAWASRSTSKEEVGSIVTDLVGLNRQQFRQVVLLPQGEFASFLRADDDARREVLVKLFGTHFFRRVTDQLQSMAQAARAGVHRAETDLATRVAAAWEACGREPRPGPDGQVPGVPAQVDQLSALTGELAAAAEAAGEVARAAHDRAAEARRSLVAAQGVVERVRRRATVAATLEEAESERPVQLERQQRSAAGHRAAPVRPLLDLVSSAGERVATARSALVEVGLHDGDLARDDVAAHAALAEQLRSQAERLGPIEVEERDLPGRRAELERDRSDWSTAQARLAVLDGQRQELPAAIQQARVDLTAARASAAGSAAIEAALGALRTRLLAAERAAALESELPGLRTAQRTARRAYEDARQAVDLLVERRLRDVRGELAARLVSGDPCAVCGSTDHPAPAEADASGVTEDDVRAASVRRDEVELARDESDRAVAHAELALASALEASGGEPAADLSERIAAAELDLADARAADDRIAALEKAVNALESDLAEATAELVPLGQSVAVLGAEVDRRAEELADVEARVSAARGDSESVAVRIQALSAEATVERARVERLSALAAAVGAERDARLRAEREAGAAGFDSLEQAAAAAMAPAELAALDGEVADWQARIDAATAQLGSADLLEVRDIALADAEAEVVDLRSEVTVQEAAAAEAQGASTLAAERSARLAARLSEVRECARTHAAAIAEADEVIALDQYARGMSGTPRMTLVTYVLRYWFEQVVQAANVRLQVMSAGKYELVREDRAARRDARVGLGLAVLDRHTGRERSPGTLSGGETFYTSLALALGLADVVVAQAGGAQLDTLFIDEGFGSLDQDTLDDVMGVIDELRGNGRVVGIVSHVPDLKERISERLSVRRSRPDGPSHVEVHA